MFRIKRLSSEKNWKIISFLRIELDVISRKMIMGSDYRSRSMLSSKLDGKRCSLASTPLHMLLSLTLSSKLSDERKKASLSEWIVRAAMRVPLWRLKNCRSHVSYKVDCHSSRLRLKAICAFRSVTSAHFYASNDHKSFHYFPCLTVLKRRTT